jgi:hypothetical protein
VRLYLRAEIIMDAAQEAAYRADNGLGSDDRLHPHLLAHVHELLAGEGALNGWWDVNLW